MNLLLDVGFNREVGEDGAVYFNKNDMNLANLINKLDQITQKQIEEISKKAKRRISEEYTWRYIVHRYENEFIKGSKK